MKRFGKIVLGAVFSFGISAGSVQVVAAETKAAVDGVQIILDGYPLPFPVQPQIISGTTMVPFRAISEALGITVLWDQTAKKITASKPGVTDAKQVVLTVGNKNALVNSRSVPLAVAPKVVSGTTLIPLSFFSQQFGAGVAWNQGTKTVSITSPKEKMYTMGFYAISSYAEISKVPSFNAVAFGWSRIDRDGNFTTQGEDFKWPKPAGEVTPEAIIQDTAAQGTTPYLMMFSVDGKSEFTRNLEDKQLQEQTISNLMDTAIGKGFKGIVLDIEGLGLGGDTAQARSDYSAFVSKLAVKAHQAGLKLTVALHPLNGAYKGYDYKTLSSLADDLIIMAYAYENEKSPEPTEKVDEAVRLAMQQVDKKKLILGISLGSENENSVNEKIGLAKRYDLKGIALWRLGLIGEQVWSKINTSIEMN